MAGLAQVSESSAVGGQAIETVAGLGVRPQRRREHWLQVDLLRIVAIVMVIATHVVIYTQPGSGTGAQALTVLFHASRFIFFFITAFVLYMTWGSRPQKPLPFWRKRFPPVLIPYLAWTLIYWQYTRLWSWGGYSPTWPGALHQLGVDLIEGWFHLYFLIVTFQLYIAFPLIAWIVRRTQGHHRLLLVVTGVLQTAGYFLMQYRWFSVPGGVQNLLQHSQVELWFYFFFFFLGAVAAAHREQVVATLRRYPLRLAALAAALLAGAFGLFGLNLLIGLTPSEAAGVFQPLTVLSFLGAVLALGVIAQHLLDANSPQSLLWRLLRWGGEISFGIYLSHMISLQFVVWLQVEQVLGLNRLPVPLDGVVVWVLTVALTILLASVLRFVPFSTALSGRPRRPLPALRQGSIAVEQKSA